MEDLKLMGLKSHDCHVLMQDLLTVTIRGILPKNVRQVIIRLCQFFNAIYRKVIDPTRLDDIMVHLIVHLVREIRICGPVFL